MKNLILAILIIITLSVSEANAVNKYISPRNRVFTTYANGEQLIFTFKESTVSLTNAVGNSYEENHVNDRSYTVDNNGLIYIKGIGRFILTYNGKLLIYIPEESDFPDSWNSNN